MTPQLQIDDILTVTGLIGGRMHYIDHNRASCSGGGILLTKKGLEVVGGPPPVFIDHNRDFYYAAPGKNLTRVGVLPGAV